MRLGGVSPLYVLAEFPPVKQFIKEIITNLDDPNLTLNQKIMFHTLLNELGIKSYQQNFHTYDKGSIEYHLSHFYNSSKINVFNQIEKEISKPFPRRGKSIPTDYRESMLSFPSYDGPN